MVYLITALTYKIASADDLGYVNSEARIDNYISQTYRLIDFGKYNRVSYEAFEMAIRGYMNLRSEGKLTSEKDVISICDLSLPSSENRMWVIDLKARKVLFHTYVAHGQGSGDDMAHAFSNRQNSHQSSLGFYVTGETYEGEHGTSLRLHGMDEGFNDAAYDRGIVVHGAPYVCDKFVNNNQRLGRSWGCPAVPDELSLPIINTIKDGSCLFIYYPDKKYLNSSSWLCRRITKLPENELYASALSALPKPKTRTIQYITNGKIDSVKVIPAQ